MPDPNQNNKFKIVIIGDAGVGKTSLVRSSRGEAFDLNLESTLGAAYSTKNLGVDDQLYVYELWDVSNNERFHSFLSQYYKDANAVLLCFDLTNLISLKNVIDLGMKIREINSNCLFYLVGTKVDLPNQFLINENTLQLDLQNLDCKDFRKVDNRDIETIQDFFEGKLLEDLFVKFPNKKIVQDNNPSKKISLKPSNLWEKVKAHPYLTALTMALVISVVALFCMPGIGQLLGIPLLTTILITKTALTFGVSLTTAKGIATIGSAIIAVSIPLAAFSSLNFASRKILYNRTIPTPKITENPSKETVVTIQQRKDFTHYGPLFPPDSVNVNNNSTINNNNSDMTNNSNTSGVPGLAFGHEKTE